MFDSLYPDAADAALKTRAGEVQPKPPTPWFQGFWGAVGSAPVRAGLETARAVKSVAPVQVGNPLAMSPTEQEEMLESEGINRRNMDRGLAIGIKEFTPDPETTGAASMILHDVGRFVGKAVGYTAAVGPVGAVAGVGLDEGYNEAARRIDEGVDPATAAKLGVVKGVASGVAVALPVAGKSLLGTLGLAAGGGPVAFVAEQATAREVLKAANYDDLAGQIDPFDPLGLGVSFLGGLAFGGAAHVMRATRAAGTPKVGAETRGVEPPTMGAEPPSQRTPVAEAVARTYTPEQVDAAHVSILQAQREGTALHRADDIAAATEHGRALDRASEQLAAGERVSVAEVAPADGARMAETVLPALARVEAAVRVVELFHGSPHEFTRFDSGRIGTGEGAQAFGHGLYLAESEGVARHYRDVLSRPQDSLGSIRNSAQNDVANNWIEQAGGDRKAAAEAFKAFAKEVGLTDDPRAFAETLRAIEEERGFMYRIQARADDMARMLDWDKPIGEQPPEVKAALKDAGYEPKNLEQPMGEFLAPKLREGMGQYLSDDLQRAGVFGISYLDGMSRGKASGTRNHVIFPGNEERLRITEINGQPLETPNAERDGGSAGPDATPTADFLARESDAIAQTDPDMMVMMEGMDGPVKASDLLAEVKAMMQQEIADAPLVQVAAECFLRG